MTAVRRRGFSAPVDKDESFPSPRVRNSMRTSPRRLSKINAFAAECLLPLDGNLDVDAEHPGEDRGGEFGGEGEQGSPAVLLGSISILCSRSPI
ncbi:hypothetical protein [Streptomyces sp. NPDC058385]|uniref:hypothetical protein n=1 Tax=Streptomyces sp. NPDC058385 TaxID=3346473 RepID=UPI003648F570